MEDNKRKYVRFYPDDGTFAQIDAEPGNEFNPEIVALILEHSEKGCGLVLLEKEFQALQGEFTIQVGNQPPKKAVIRWNQELDSKIKKVGVEYI